MDHQKQMSSNKIFTVPNLLSIARLALIPLLLWLYLKKEAYGWTAAVLLLSGLTDVADGCIARRFHLVSDFGKALDPVADKLTQFAMLLCLVHRFPAMLIPLSILVAKELITGLFSLVVVCTTKTVEGADWHGKVCTVLLYGTMALHLLFPHIPQSLSRGSILACTAMMVISFILYTIRNIRALTGKREPGQTRS